mmetsp:Transcript_12323/g.25530  ORF Transcript_12323/g.25530 Transcript_12323/m.25530 type:complete len:251 (+) Transcript_12323:1502-2254(+)
MCGKLVHPSPKAQLFLGSVDTNAPFERYFSLFFCPSFSFSFQPLLCNSSSFCFPSKALSFFLQSALLLGLYSSPFGFQPFLLFLLPKNLFLLLSLGFKTLSFNLLPSFSFLLSLLLRLFLSFHLLKLLLSALFFLFSFQACGFFLFSKPFHLAFLLFFRFAKLLLLLSFDFEFFCTDPLCLLFAFLLLGHLQCSLLFLCSSSTIFCATHLFQPFCILLHGLRRAYHCGYGCCGRTCEKGPLATFLSSTNG